MKIVSAEEMRAIDRVTTERFGVPSLTLMENAGSSVARFILSEYPQSKRISVICGKGNNGGDGLVVARHLAETGRVVRVLLLCSPEQLLGDASAMFQKLKLLPLVVRDPEGLDSVDAAPIFVADLLVDAILGTGFRPPVSDLYAAAIARMNQSKVRIVAVDIPSGADADAMESGSGLQARADAVVTFTAPRPAHVLGGLTSGPTVIAPIGSPAAAIESKLGLDLSVPKDFAALLAPRKIEANKGSYGHVLVVGGSTGKAGAAALAAFASLRVGAGLATVATAKSSLPTVAGFHPEVMTEPLAETESGTISLAASPSLVALMERKSVLAIGPGISRVAETAEFVRSAVLRCAIPIVLDADGLNAYEGRAHELKRQGRTMVITPHPGEMSRLTGISVGEIQNRRIEIARKFACDQSVIVALKGHRTLIAAPDGTVWVNPTGNPGMATGGTGDVLTGLIAGLIAQNPDDVLGATTLAVYLHGSAGDLAARELGERSIVASDLVRFLPEAFQAALRERGPEVRIHA